jgi:hypothetical protein
LASRKLAASSIKLHPPENPLSWSFIPLRKKRELVEALFSPSAYPRPAYVAADLAAVPLMDALEAAAVGFDRSKPALFTVEGLVS